ncbi:spermidine hydroxycinnamoyl transferase-like [Henckelia pumila]|uniref:spermidine hydroxycinnamoyl transferase-like n=1 Tax=Henckelia pumila TaxID=405737 RepID=UPI003C6DFD82
MKFVVKNSCLVQPAEATWNGVMALTEFDQIGAITHPPTLYFYRPSETWLAQEEIMFTTLRDSLSRILVHFYPLAGRLRWLDGGRLELECNGEGVALIQVESDATLDDLGDLSLSPHFHHLSPKINYKAPIEEIPLLFVQLTKFKCGGIALSHALSHAVVDGQSAFHFASEWARLARGESLGKAPFLDRKLLRAGDPPSAQPCFDNEWNEPPVLITQPGSENDEIRNKGNAVAMLKLTKKQVEMLKNEANRTKSSYIDDGDHRMFSRYESVTAHIWRCACKARGHVYEQPTGVGISVDIRKRVEPPLPQTYFGNATTSVIATDCAGDVVTKPSGYAASRIRQAINKVSSAYVHSTLDNLKNLKDFTGLQDIHAMELEASERMFVGNPNLWVSSWTTLALNGLDFGWGNEMYMSPGPHDGDGESLTLPGQDGDGSMVVALHLQAAHIEDFKKFFYQTI